MTAVHLKPRLTEWYGWRPDLPDDRDHHFLPAVARLPSSIDLRADCPPVYDQSSLGSCTANAVAFLVEYLTTMQGKPGFVPSRLFIYYLERLLEGTVSTDSGAEIRDGMKVVHKYGAPHESLWPYDVSKFAKRPPDKVYADALRDIVDEYVRVVSSAADAQQRVASVKASLAQRKPVAFGFTVYESFESDAVSRTGVVPMPRRGESAIGGHAVAAVGYSDATSRFLVRNSWGPKWGMAGYFTMPYQYIAKATLSSDFWNVSRVS